MVEPERLHDFEDLHYGDYYGDDLHYGWGKHLEHFDEDSVVSETISPYLASMVGYRSFYAD